MQFCPFDLLPVSSLDDEPGEGSEFLPCQVIIVVVYLKGIVY